MDLIKNFSLFPWLIGHRTQILGAAVVGLQIAAAAGGIPLDPAMIDLITKGLGGLATVTFAQKVNRFLAANYGGARLAVPVAMLALTLGMTGCAGQNPFGETETYRVTLSATGIVPINPTGLGNIPVPQNGEGLINLAVLLAGKHLAEEKRMKSCLFQSYPPTLQGRSIIATASAICKLDGIPVSETITLTLDPVSS